MVAITQHHWPAAVPGPESRAHAAVYRIHDEQEARRHPETRPVDLPKQALTRIADLVGRGGLPDRVAREAQAIVAAWRADAELDQGEVTEHLAACCESLAEGVEAARAQMEDGDSSDKAAAAQGTRSLAALEAAYQAMREAARA